MAFENKIANNVTLQNDNTYDFGQTLSRIKDIYIAGNVSDGTTTTPISTILIGGVSESLAIAYAVAL